MILGYKACQKKDLKKVPYCEQHGKPLVQEYLLAGPQVPSGDGVPEVAGAAGVAGGAGVAGVAGLDPVHCLLKENGV